MMRRNRISRAILIAIVFAFAHLQSFSQIAAGGGFVLEQSVIGAGGNKSGSTSFEVSGTMAQTVAGTSSSGGGIEIRGGFWQPLFAPTAAGVAVSGRVTDTLGNGIGHVIVTLTDLTGVVQLARTGPFGYYRFENIAAGQIYYVSVSAKRHAFAEPTRFINVLDEVTDVDFVAEPLS
jgi:hypothetical protein